MQRLTLLPLLAPALGSNSVKLHKYPYWFSRYNDSEPYGHLYLIVLVSPSVYLAKRAVDPYDSLGDPVQESQVLLPFLKTPCMPCA